MPASTPTLRDMIREAVDRGQTYEQLGRRTKGRPKGETVSGGYLNKIVLGNVPRMPTAELLRAIAVAIDVPYERVRLAAITQWLPVDSSSAEAERAEIVQTARRLHEVADELMGHVESQGGAEPTAETA